MISGEDGQVSYLITGGESETNSTTPKSRTLGWPGRIIRTKNVESERTQRQLRRLRYNAYLIDGIVITLENISISKTFWNKPDYMSKDRTL